MGRKKKEDIYDDQYWYEKDREECAESEPKHEEQDKEYGKGESASEKKLIDLTGHWFVSFGVDSAEGKMEGCRILTLKGGFDPDNFIDVLVSKIQDTLPNYAKEFLDKCNQKIVIRSFNRIDQPSVVSAVTI